MPYKKGRKLEEGEEKQMKRAITILLALLMVLSFAACGDWPKEGAVKSTKTPTQENTFDAKEAFHDFHGKYDCLYMPYDYEKNGNKGYAFINFVNPLHILLFYEKFNGKKWRKFDSIWFNQIFV